MVDITLTQEQRDRVKADMDQQVEMLSAQEVEKIATLLNKKVDIPFMTEDREHTMIIKIVKKIDRLLYQNLPNEIYGLVKDVQDGISDEDAAKLERVLASRLNKEVNFPYLPEWIEQQIFETVIGLIVTAMRKHLSINEMPTTV